MDDALIIPVPGDTVPPVVPPTGETPPTGAKSPGDCQMPVPAASGGMQDSTAVMMEQAFAKSHTLGLAVADRGNAGNENVAEQTRLLFLTRTQANDLAQDILDERSAEQQPQVGVIPPAKAIVGA